MVPPSFKERNFSFCPKFSGSDLNNLLIQCPHCTRFFAACCQCHQRYESEQYVCQHVQLVFTDGACSNNGRGRTAKAGLGIFIGDDDDLFWSIKVDDTLDTAPRTNQRAELLAAIEGLKKLEQVNQLESIDSESPARGHANADQDYRAEYIVVTDSEYVVKGITEWFPEWRVSRHSSWSYKLSNTDGIVCRIEDGVELMENLLRTLTYLRNWTNMPRPWRKTALQLDFCMFQELTTTGLINSRRKLPGFKTKVSHFLKKKVSNVGQPRWHLCKVERPICFLCCQTVNCAL